MGVHDVRLTGGEPLIRREFPHLVSMLSSDRWELHDLAITTNGFLLERDAAALIAAGAAARNGTPGLRFNVSVDSLQRDRFYALTRRERIGSGVLRGLGPALPSFPKPTRSR